MAEEKSKYSRRDFIKLSGATFLSLGIGGCQSLAFWKTEEEVAVIPVAEGYLLVDMKKCAGCYSCMLTCSLVHHGEENLSLARIQVVQDPFEPFPNDIYLSQCRQCVEPACVEVCPVEALRAEPKFGNIRVVDQEKCMKSVCILMDKSAVMGLPSKSVPKPTISQNCNSDWLP